MQKRLRCMVGAILLIALLLTGCSEKKATVTVTWIDADGMVLDTQTVAIDYDPKTKTLPKDSNDWHYTGWELSRTGDVLVCTATRVANLHFVWKDYDGTVLKEIYAAETEELPTFDLPTSSDKWEYTEWVQTESGKSQVYEAERTPNTTYFVGNVFQIVLKDINGDAIGSGSGFVINEDGWFITNNHVMEDGHTAVAFFDIKDSNEGQPYTQLKISGGVYNNENTDIFIGKLEGYSKISQYYQPISFTEEYQEGDVSYSLGYPNSSIKLQINAGKILEEYSDIHDKIDGVYYVLSDSYIAPGSSGGILINENFEVIGITSIGFYADSDKTTYTSGGSVPYFLFKNALAQLSENHITPIYEIYKK